MQPDASSAHHSAHDVARVQRQDQHVVGVHVRDGDRVHLAGEVSPPQALERTRAAIEEHRSGRVRDHIRRTRTLQRRACGEAKHLEA